MDNQLDTASAAIRQHIHDKPYHDEPQTIYGDLGTVREILGRLTGVLERISTAAGDAIESDLRDNPADPFGIYAAADEVLHLRGFCMLAIEKLNMAERNLSDAHTAAGHLIFAASPE